MDTSKEYILMCEKANEIQELKPSITPADFMGCIYPRNAVWLPRQDQLQEMAVNRGKNGPNTSYWHKAVEFFEYWMKNGIWAGSSMEQLWLAFVMKEKYGKIWNSTDWVKNP